VSATYGIHATNKSPFLISYQLHFLIISPHPFHFHPLHFFFYLFILIILLLIFKSHVLLPLNPLLPDLLRRHFLYSMQQTAGEESGYKA